MKRVWILGAGGHARVVIDTLRVAGGFEIAGILDDDPSLKDTELTGVHILGSITPEAVDKYAIVHAITAIGANAARMTIVRRFERLVSWVSVVHPRAYIAEDVRVGEGTAIFAGAVVQPAAVIGNHVILNTSCSVDHDCRIGDYSHIAPGAHLCGSVVVSEGAMLGAASCVIPRQIIGAWSTIGAGAVVTREIPSTAHAKGVPARYTPDAGNSATPQSNNPMQ